QHPPSESFQRVVQVQSVTTGTLSGYYGTDGNYKLYHFNSSCPSNGTNCPLYTVKVVPDATGLDVTITIQELVNSSWKPVGSGSVKLGTGSKVTVALVYPPNVIGHSFRVMASFKGNGGTLPSSSGWAYFRITK